jgi:type III pantothenate kinase
MNCIVDRGNSKTKIYFFEGDELLKSASFLNNDKISIQGFLKKNSFNTGFISTTSNLPSYLKGNKFKVLDINTPIPIKINYNSPETLGTDRIALACGAQYLYPNQNCLIISAGTCITLDILDKEGVYQGGIICPGIQMRAKAMHFFTKKLPLIHFSSKLDFPLLGKSSIACLESGVFNGALAEISSYIEQFSALYKDLTVIITGGDRFLFEFRLKNKIFAQENLQALGLNRILRYNAKNN